MMAGSRGDRSTAPPSPASAAQQRAYRKWSAAQSCAQREHWGQAAIEFELAQAPPDDSAYALPSAHAPL